MRKDPPEPGTDPNSPEGKNIPCAKQPVTPVSTQDEEQPEPETEETA